MTRLDLDVERPASATCKDVTLRSPPNWTAVLFFAALGMLHLYMAASAFSHRRWEGFMSLIFGTLFCAVSIAFRLVCRDLTMLSSSRRLRLHTGFRKLGHERFIPFAQVRNVRLTLMHPRNPLAATIEIVCEREVIECPPTRVPREEALCLAMTMNAPLIKVYGEEFGHAAERLDQLPSA